MKMGTVDVVTMLLAGTLSRLPCQGKGHSTELSGLCLVTSEQMTCIWTLSVVVGDDIAIWSLRAR